MPAGMFTPNDPLKSLKHELDELYFDSLKKGTYVRPGWGRNYNIRIFKYRSQHGVMMIEYWYFHRTGMPRCVASLDQFREMVQKRGYVWKG